MTIKDMEERSGLPRANIRYYETEGLLSPTRSPNGYRDYSEDDLATLMKVKLLRELGCTLEEIAALQRNETALSDVVERRSLWRGPRTSAQNSGPTAPPTPP